MVGRDPLELFFSRRFICSVRIGLGRPPFELRSPLLRREIFPHLKYTISRLWIHLPLGSPSAQSIATLPGWVFRAFYVKAAFALIWFDRFARTYAAGGCCQVSEMMLKKYLGEAQQHTFVTLVQVRTEHR